jgi:hypothetical protein
MLHPQKNLLPLMMMMQLQKKVSLPKMMNKKIIIN